MVNFERFVLDNGLKVLVHRDTSTPMAAVNVLYDVGARDEDPELTGLAHLFEHLMFEGSAHIPDYDKALQVAGGENNAFTTNDITNYYLTIPAHNLETAFWLESDRMMKLDFSETKLQIQKNVVSEEFRQSYLNQPYGDVWMLLRSLIYTQHSYRWPTIGLSIEHVQQATLQNIQDFFFTYYRPDNAILVVSGNVQPREVLALARKWFGDIAPSVTGRREILLEPPQTAHRNLTVERDVPFDEIYLAFPTGTRKDANYFTTDLLSDILASGKSARLKQKLVKEKKFFLEANAYITGSIDRGFLTVMGRLCKGNSIEEAYQLLWAELQELIQSPIAEDELQKVKNKIEANYTFSETGILSKAMNLAYYELLGDASQINQQVDHYNAISAEQLMTDAQNIFQHQHLSELRYLSLQTP